MGHDAKWKWQENVFEIIKRRPTAPRRKRRLGESLMIAATCLSAIATAATGAIALMQYRTMERSITAPNRNESFAGMLDALHDACEPGLKILVAGVRTELDNSKFSVDRGTMEEFADKTTKLVKSIQNYQIWVPESQRGFLKSIDTLFVGSMRRVLPMPSLDEEARTRAAQKAMPNLAHVCIDGGDALIQWFQTGKPFSLDAFKEKAN